MTGMLIRLAAPMQSWGERGTYGERDTADFPTRSGLLGLLASAAGIPRGSSLGELTELDFTVRIDRPGVRVIDYHTIGGNYPIGRGIPTADGKRRDTAILTNRHYLSDAVFTVACNGVQETVNRAAGYLQAPHWQPFLGRRSCPPEQPILLGIYDDACAQLHGVPLPRHAPRNSTTISVDFIDTATPADPNVWSEIRDDVDAFPRGDRHYRRRALSKTTHALSAHLCHGDPERYRDAVAAFMTGETK